VAKVIGLYCRFDREDVNGAVLSRLETAATQFGFRLPLSTLMHWLFLLVLLLLMRPATAVKQSGTNNLLYNKTTCLRSLKAVV
jgi:hypothetical protein